MTKPHFHGTLAALFWLLTGAVLAVAPPWTASPDRGNILLMSDIHFDPYSGTSSQAISIRLNRLSASPVEDWPAIFSETTKDEKFPGYGQADTNFPLLESALQEAASTGVTYDFGVITGDYVSHHYRDDFERYVRDPDPKEEERLYQSFVLKTLTFVTRAVQERFPQTPMIFTLGNNDSDCDDYGGITPGTALLPGLAQQWKLVAKDPEAIRDFAAHGFYAIDHPVLPKRRVIVLDDVVWSYKFSAACKMDPAQQVELAWLQSQLERARVAGERVTLVSHMPPGIHSRNASEHPDRGRYQKTFYAQQYLWPFLNILAPYRDILDAHFAGHTHLDDFRVVLDRGGQAVFFTHITPAISPLRYNNPGFQVMLFDRSTGTLQDMATYVLTNLETAGPGGEGKWKLEYTFREAYGLKAYNAENLLALTDAVESDPAIRKKFIDYGSLECPVEPVMSMGYWRFFSCAHTHLDPRSFGECSR